MYSYDYIFEKFTQALCDLATGKGDARSRIGEAYYKFWHIKLEEFPVEIRHKRLEIDRLLTKLPGRTGYLIPDNLARMKNKTAAKIARLILDIYFELEEFRKSTKFKNSYIFLSKTDDKCEGYTLRILTQLNQ